MMKNQCLLACNSLLKVLMELRISKLASSYLVSSSLQSQERLSSMWCILFRMNSLLLCLRFYMGLFLKRSIFYYSSMSYGVVKRRQLFYLGEFTRKKEVFYRFGPWSVCILLHRKRLLAAFALLILLIIPRKVQCWLSRDCSIMFSSFSGLLKRVYLTPPVLLKLRSETGVAVRLVLLVVTFLFFLYGITSSRFYGSTDTALMALKFFIRTDWYFFLKKPMNISMAQHSMSQCLTLASFQGWDSQSTSL